MIQRPGHGFCIAGSFVSFHSLKVQNCLMAGGGMLLIFVMGFRIWGKASLKPCRVSSTRLDAMAAGL